MKPLKLIFGLFLLFFLFAKQSIGQCPTDTILIFSTQSEINSFIVDYPNCTNFEGEITVWGSEGYPVVGDNIISSLAGLQNIQSVGNLTVYKTFLTNLNDLEELTTVSGDLKLRNNDLLTSISGLENLTSVSGVLQLSDNDLLTTISSFQNLNILGGLRITNNSQLTTISNFQNIISLSSFLSIGYNSSLINLSGFDNLVSVGGSFGMSNNEALASLNTFDNLSSIGDFFSFTSMDALTSLSGLENLSSIGGSFALHYNTSLSGFSALENLTSIAEDIRIHTNGSLTNMNGLENITAIGGNLSIYNNNSMTSFNGLENLSTIGGYMLISSNELLLNLNGLDNLISINGYAKIAYQESILDLNGLDNLTSIGEHLEILENNALLSLTGLGSLNSIGEAFTIIDNNSLASLAGLQNLSFLGGLEINNNDSLVSINNLETLTSIGGDVKIRNYGITSLSGLHNVTSIDGNLDISSNNLSSLTGLESLSSINGNMEISSEYSLSNLNGLENLSTINGNVKISYNHGALESLTGIDNISSITGNVYIFGNENLSECAVFPICQYLSEGPGSITLDDNATGCNTENEVLSNCQGFAKVNFYCFYDLNSNGLLEIEEPPLPTMGVNVDPGDVTLYGTIGEATVKYLAFDEYNLILDEEFSSDWSLNDGSSNYTLSLDSTNICDTVYFGLTPNTLFADFSLENYPGTTDCYGEEIFSPKLRNTGTTTTSGTFWFTVDDSFSVTEYIDPPDTIVDETRIGWFFSDLFPQEVFEREIRLELPGPPEFAHGHLFNQTMEAEYSDQLNSDQLFSQPFSVEISCISTATEEISISKPQIFPNPTSGMFEVDFPVNMEGSYEIRNISGQLIKKGILNKENLIDLSEEQQGMYLLIMKSKRGNWTERIIKM